MGLSGSPMCNSLLLPVVLNCNAYYKEISYKSYQNMPRHRTINILTQNQLMQNGQKQRNDISNSLIALMFVIERNGVSVWRLIICCLIKMPQRIEMSFVYFHFTISRHLKFKNFPHLVLIEKRWKWINHGKETNEANGKCNSTQPKILTMNIFYFLFSLFGYFIFLNECNTRALVIFSFILFGSFVSFLFSSFVFCVFFPFFLLYRSARK